MRLEPNQSNPVGIALILVSIGGLIGAIFLGQMIAQNEYKQIGAIAGVAIGMAICLAMGRKIWMLIPLLWPLTGKISLLPLPFSVREIGIIAAVGMFIMFTTFKKVPKLARPSTCDFFLYANLLYLFTVYVNNPVGVNALGADRVGGRPYFEIALALAAYWVLQHVTLTVNEIRRFPLLMSAGAILVSGINLITMRLPFLVPFVAPFYSGVNIETYMGEVTGRESSNFRVSGGLAFGSTWTTLLASYYRPVTLFLFLKPVQSIIFYGAIAAIGLSGFRVGILQLMMFILVSSYFQKGISECLKVIAASLMVISLVIALQGMGISVHPAIQRSLSFIPGPWDEYVIRDADGTKEWRLEIWKIAWESERYIKNKIWGDGFGFTAEELEIQMRAAFGGTGFIGGNEAEAQLITGAYHSGPLSTIRYVGIIGLILYLMLQTAMAFYAFRIIRRSYRTPSQPLALFVGGGLIYAPLFFIFIFGAYDTGLSDSIFSLAMLNLIDRTQASCTKGGQGEVKVTINASGDASKLSI